MINEQIWEIHTFGTSFTKGGGFEFWHNPYLKEVYKDIPTPKIQFNFSWPGQLQDMLLESGYKTQVHNHAKSGYGHELAIREAYKIISKNFEEQKRHDSNGYKLFIFEFGGLGRKEHHINELGYLISNYHFKTNNTDFTHIVDDDTDVKTVTHSVAQTYFEDTKQTLDKIDKYKKIIEDFNAETIEFNSYQHTMSTEILNFIGYLEKLKINYLIASSPFLTYPLRNFSEIWRGKDIHYKTDDGDIHLDLYGFVKSEKLLIKDETEGLIPDGHAGFKGNKKIAEHIFKKILKDYILPIHKVD